MHVCACVSMFVRACVCPCVCVSVCTVHARVHVCDGLMILLTAGETPRWGRSTVSPVSADSVSSCQSQSEDQQTQRDPETGECVCVHLCWCVTHGVNGLMILLTAGGETRRRGKSALSSVSDSISSRQRGGTGAKSGGN